MGLSLIIYHYTIFSEKVAWHVVSFSIFGASMILLYLFSTLLHSFKPSKAKNVFAVLDHSAIYVLIAGTYTPLMLVSVRSALGWTLFGIVWGLAIIGIIFKCYFVDRFQIVSTLFYLVMGWLVLAAIKPLYESLTPAGFDLLLTGGILYSVGAVVNTGTEPISSTSSFSCTP